MANTSSRVVIIGRAQEFCDMRATVIKLLYPIPTTTRGRDTTDEILNNLANSFSRFAGNQQTAFDNGAGRTAANTGGNMLELQVERAFAQVLGRAIGRGGTSNFMNALNAAFPTAPDGQVMFLPQRGMTSLYSPNGGTPSGSSAYGSYSSGINPYSNSSLGGAVGQLSTKQAALYREASVVAGDALKVLAGLKPFLPTADIEEVEALRSLVQREISALVEEFGRVDEPRKTRVEDYLKALQVDLTEFGQRALLDDPKRVTTADDEAQTAGFLLLNNYTRILSDIWKGFDKSEKETPIFSLSEQVERANVILPIIAQGNVDFQAALDSVAFTESEQRSRAAKFTILNDLLPVDPLPHVPGPQPDGEFQEVYNVGKQLPDLTVRDLIEWLDRFANIEGPTILADSGQFGLEFVTDQADSLFWTIVPIVSVLQSTDTSNSRVMLRQVLSNERVKWALDNLLGQLKVLADLACPGEGQLLWAGAEAQQELSSGAE